METKRRRLLWWTLASLIALMCLGLILAAYRFGWTGAGFAGKTVWDWLQLLIIPLVLALVALAFNQVNTRTEREIALEKQREDLLQAYLDRMAELLLDKGLRTSPPDAEVRNIARVRTISILTQLEVRRVEHVFTFLREAGLVEAPEPIISFKHARFTTVNWRFARLDEVNLSGADLSMADLSGADLRRANLSGANLNGVSLRRADLRWTNLSKANLSEAFYNNGDIISPDLSEANLSKADLREADLRVVARLKRPITRSLQDVNLRIIRRPNNTKLVNVSRTPLEDALSLQDADLRGVKGLNKKQLATCKAKGAIVDEDPSTSASQSTIAPTPPLQSNSVQASSVSLAQGSLPSPNTNGSNASSSKPNSGS